MAMGHFEHLAVVPPQGRRSQWRSCECADLAMAAYRRGYRGGISCGSGGKAQAGQSRARHRGDRRPSVPPDLLTLAVLVALASCAEPPDRSSSCSNLLDERRTGLQRFG